MGFTENVMPLSDLAKNLKVLILMFLEINGHNFREIDEAKKSSSQRKR